MRIKIKIDDEIFFDEGCNVNKISKTFYASNDKKVVALRRSQGDIEIEIINLDKTK